MFIIQHSNNIEKHKEEKKTVNSSFRETPVKALSILPDSSRVCIPKIMLQPLMAWGCSRTFVLGRVLPVKTGLANCPQESRK